MDLSLKSDSPSPLSETDSSMFGRDAPSSEVTSIHSGQESCADRSSLVQSIEQSMPEEPDQTEGVICEETRVDDVKPDPIDSGFAADDDSRDFNTTTHTVAKKGSEHNLDVDEGVSGTVVILSRPVSPAYIPKPPSKDEVPPVPTKDAQNVKQQRRQSIAGDRNPSLKRPKSPRPLAAPPPPMPEQVYVEPTIELTTGPKSFHAIVHGKTVQSLPSKRAEMSRESSASAVSEPEKTRVVKVVKHDSVEPPLNSPDLSMLVAQAVQLEQRLGDGNEEGVQKKDVPMDPESELSVKPVQRVKEVQEAVETESDNPPTPPPKETSRFRSFLAFPSVVASTLGVKSLAQPTTRESWSSEKSSEESTAVMTPPSPTFDLVTPPLFDSHRNATRTKSMRTSRSMHSVRSDSSSTKRERARSPSPSPSGSSLWSHPRKPSVQAQAHAQANPSSKKGPSGRANSFVGKMFSRASRSSSTLALPGNAPSLPRSVSPSGTSRASRTLSRVFSKTPPPPPSSVDSHTSVSSIASTTTTLATTPTPTIAPTSPKPPPSPQEHLLTYDVPPPALRHLDDSTCDGPFPPSPNSSYAQFPVTPTMRKSVLPGHATPEPIPPVPPLPTSTFLPENTSEHLTTPHRTPRSRRSSQHHPLPPPLVLPEPPLPPPLPRPQAQLGSLSSRPHSAISTRTTSSATSTATSTTAISIFSPSFDRGIFDAFPSVPQEPLPPLPPEYQRLNAQYHTTGTHLHKSSTSHALPPIPIPIPIAPNPYLHEHNSEALKLDPGPPPDMDLPPTPPSALSLFSALSKSLTKGVGTEETGKNDTKGLSVSKDNTRNADSSTYTRSRRTSRISTWFDNDESSTTVRTVRS